jgi:hypothetical protein
VADTPRERWTATPRRQVLRDRLEKASTRRLAAFYMEAVRALREGNDEVRFSVAGHMLRELQAGLPTHLNVPQEKGKVGEFFEWLRVTWVELIKGRPEKSGREMWRDATVDRPFAKFLATLHDKIQFYAGIRPRKRDEHSAMLGKLDPSLGHAPETVRTEIADTWMGLNDIFNTATHSVDPDEFEKAVETFELVLEDRLAPRTVEKQDAITAFVKEFEGRAEA